MNYHGDAMTPRILVVGVGNEMRGDDGVGILLAKRIASIGLPSVSVKTLQGDMTELYYIWQDADVVIILDAIDAHLQPGEWCLLTESTVATVKQISHQSTHSISLIQTLEIARTLGMMPPKFYFIGVQIENVDVGKQLSKRVESRLPTIVEQVLQLIQIHLHSLNV